jgi:hypothetical protein
MHESGSTTPAADVFEAERAYLENLLATRMNFYLVFVSFYFVAVFGAEQKVATPGQRTIALALGGVVSLLMTLSVLRTTALVENVLSRFRAKHTEHPYTKAHADLSGKWAVNVSANRYLALVPLGVTVAFFWLALLAGRTS